MGGIEARAARCLSSHFPEASGAVRRWVRVSAERRQRKAPHVRATGFVRGCDCWEAVDVRKADCQGVSMSADLRIVPCSLRKANDFVAVYHRHSKRTARNGGKFAVAIA